MLSLPVSFSPKDDSHHGPLPGSEISPPPMFPQRSGSRASNALSKSNPHPQPPTPGAEPLTRPDMR